MSMSLRHAAALALVGWYLMAASGDTTPAPLTWFLIAPFKGREIATGGGTLLGNFGTQEQCEERRSEVRKAGFKRLAGARLDTDFARATCSAVFRPNLLLNDHHNS
jgi:hypothetical protein